MAQPAMSPLISPLEHEFPSAKSRGDQSEDSEDNDSSVDEVDVKGIFDDIKKRLKNGKLSVRDAAEASKFIQDYQAHLCCKTADKDGGRTLLHMLVKEATDEELEKYQVLVKVLIERGLLKEKDYDHKTPLQSAINKGRDQLVRLMCDAHNDPDAILSISSHRNENCLHLAIHQSVEPNLAVYLIRKAGRKTLCGQDEDGRTPLHLAVEYNRCTNTQLTIVEALVKQCEGAMKIQTKSPNYFSPYRFHEETRREAERARHRETMREKKHDDNAKFGLLPHEGKDKAPGNRPSRSGAHNVYDEHGRPASGESKNAGQGSGMELGRLPMSKLRLEMAWTSDGKESDPKTPVLSRETNRRKERKKAKVTEESANAIREFLKLRCMRKMNHDDAVDFLYGRNPEKQIYFDLSGFSSPTVNEERIEQIFNQFQFEDILQYVEIPNIQLEKKTTTSNSPRTAVMPPEAKGRRDMVLFFKLLRKRGVKRVIRVIVDDTKKPEHSDDAIEEALGGLNIEVWDWRKFDLCTETIKTAAPDAREVFLYWSGNNAVLRGWSEPEGLKALNKLQKVHLHVERGLETAKRTKTNVESFRERLKFLCKDIKVEEVTEPQIQMQSPRSGPVNLLRERMEQRHRWLTCMDEFADFIQNAARQPAARQLEPHERVKIALIDDGIDINDHTLHDKIINGRSFGLRDSRRKLNEPYYVTSGGHGTVMASLICRICPMVQLYILKLDEYVSEHSTRQITAESAARAVQAAIDKPVDIISMSWTIERTDENSGDLDKLKTAITRAAEAGILMFCAANDQGIARDHSFPACGNTERLFKIGAATASGSVWKWVGDPADVDFIFPGHNVVKERPKDAPLEKCKTLTGSSVATAIAAGLAALVLCCVQIAALQAGDPEPTGPRSDAVTMEDFKALKQHDRMKEVFHKAIGTSPASGHKFIEVWDVFGIVAKARDKERSEIVLEVAKRLKQTKRM